jgi:hypothetical protein
MTELQLTDILVEWKASLGLRHYVLFGINEILHQRRFHEQWDETSVLLGSDFVFHG